MAKCAMEHKDMENKLSIRAKAALFLYRGLHALVSTVGLVAVPFLNKYCQRVKEGFNDYLGKVTLPQKTSKFVLWVHGVSMGESMVALNFAKELKKKYPNCTLVFTTTHPDVIKDAKKRNIADAVAYFPLDNKYSMERTFNRWQPKAVFVAETDFWPEFSYSCRERGIKLYLINGRISSKIADFYTKARGIAEVVFGAFTSFAVQSKIDKDRLVAIGVEESKIFVLGNMKADFTQTKQVNLDSVSLWINSRKTVVFGSLHPEEFQFLKPMFTRLIKEKIALIIAPRNIALADEWKADLEKSGLSVAKKTQIDYSDVLILDTIGELATVYKLSSLSFVGGSLDHNKTGGHNPLEVLQQRVPLIMGNYYRNFTDIVDQLKSTKGISIIEGPEQGYNCIMEILNNSEKAASMVAAGDQVLASNQGVLNRTLELFS